MPASGSGQVAPAERELIDKVFAFGSRRVSEIMTPRDRIFALDLDTAVDRIIAEVAHGHYSRVPVYRGDPNNIVGVLRAKDLVARRLESTPPRLERLIREPYFVPPGKTLGELFDEMRRRRFQLAFVVDEYGHLLGLVTLEDLLEELFGELRDEFELEGPDLTEAGDGEWLALAGTINLARLTQALDGGDSFATRGHERTLEFDCCCAGSAGFRAGRAASPGRLRGENRKSPRRDDRAGEAQTMELGALVAAIAACLMVQAFFAASEIAMVVTDESKLGAANERGPAANPRCSAAAAPPRARARPDAHRGQSGDRHRRQRTHHVSSISSGPTHLISRRSSWLR